MNIKFVDLARQNARYNNQLHQAFERVFTRSSFILGKYVKGFEEAFASYCGKKYAVGVNSGVDGLQLSLMAYGIGVGDEVITVPNSYFGTAMVINNVGAIPVFVDIDPNFYTINVNKIEEKITKKTRAIVPVHLYGQVAQMDIIIKIAKKHNLVIIEDACQAHGAKFNDKMVPISETGVFSFYPGKNLGCFGDGGMVVTDNARVAEKLQYLRNDGSKEKYIHTMFGAKSRLDELQASFLIAKLKHLDKWNKKRRNHAHAYKKLLQGISGLVLPVEAEYAYHNYHIFVIEHSKRDELKEFLKQNGIAANIHYPIPIHLQKAYVSFSYKTGDFPISEEKSKKILSLPMFPELTEKEIKYIAQKIKDFAE